MTAPTLGSIMLGSADPDALRAWYADTFDVVPEEHGQWMRFGDVGLVADGRDDVAAQTVEPGRVLLNLHVADAQAVVRALDAKGVTWIAPLEDRGYGWFATLTDPDGNRVQILQMTGDDHTADSSPVAGGRAFSGFSVDDLDAARAFYGDTLGLGLREEEMPGIVGLQLPGGATAMVYEKADHVPATFTVLNFGVGDVHAAVDALTARGVTFERYEGFEQDERGIHTGGGPLIAWFTDPAGNVLSVMEQ